MRLKAVCQIIIEEESEIKKEIIEQLLFRLERIANTSCKFRAHISQIGKLYIMSIGTNDETVSENDLITEIDILEEILKILNNDIICYIHVLKPEE